MKAGDGKLAFRKSRLLHENSKKVIPGGVNSNVRMGEKPHPISSRRVRVPSCTTSTGTA